MACLTGLFRVPPPIPLCIAPTYCVVAAAAAGTERSAVGQGLMFSWVVALFIICVCMLLNLNASCGEQKNVFLTVTVM